MRQTKGFLDECFEKVCETLYINKVKSLVLVMMLASIFAWHLPNLVIDTSTIGFLSEDHPGRVQYKKFLDQYGRDDAVIIAIESDNIFSEETLNKVKQMHYALEENVPYLDGVESLINARRTYGEDDTLTVDELLGEWPETENDFKKIKELVLANPNYANFLISEDATFTTILVKLGKTPETEQGDLFDGFSAMEEISVTADFQFLSGKEETDAIQAINAVINQHKDSNTNMYVSGSAVVLDALKSSLMSDMPIFMGGAIFLIIVVLFALFRRLSGVVVPMAVVMLSMISTFGLMAWVGVAFTVATQILPSFLIAVAVGATVHLLVIFYRSFDAGADKREAICYAANHSGSPIAMTSITTAIGFLSFLSADLEPVVNLGWVSACGIMFVFFYTMTLVPITLGFSDIKRREVVDNSGKAEKSHFDRILEGTAEISINNPGKVLSISCVIMVVSFFGATLVEVSYNPLNWFPEDKAVRINTEHLNDKLKGVNTFEIVFDTGVENGVYNPEFLKGLERAKEQILPLSEDTVFIGKVHSIADVIKEINQALNNNDPKYYQIPETREMIAQQFLLFENTGSDDLEIIVDSQFRETRMTIKVPWENASKYVVLLPKIEAVLDSMFPPTIKIGITGVGTLYGEVLKEITTSTLESYMIALLVISGLMIVFLGGFRVGLLSMIPNVAPIVITMGFMGYAGVTLNIFTMLIGSIAIGLAVDDTIHFMHNYKRNYFMYGRDSSKAVKETLLGSGRAMLVTTLVLSTGFLVFTASSMSNLSEFGLITGMSIILALLSDFFLAPAIVILLSKYIYSPVSILKNEISNKEYSEIERRKSQPVSGFSGIERRDRAFSYN
ncbi:MAG: MMPL family transporter [Gammaproteobacteria bacterium]|nr:MMPL family transporter [Gammaproteobacteria bacterium]